MIEVEAKRTLNLDGPTKNWPNTPSLLRPKKYKGGSMFWSAHLTYNFLKVAKLTIFAKNLD